MSEFTLRQKLSITTALESPFWLDVVFVSLQRKTKRTKFRCGYAALQALKDAKLALGVHYGADVADSNGTLVAEREHDR